MQASDQMIKCKIICNNNDNNVFSNTKKKLLHISISSETDKNFRSLIMQKYTKIEKGLLSYEVELALKHWLALHTSAQNSDLRFSEKPNPTPKVMLVFAEVKNYLIRKYYIELPSGSQVNIKHLEEAIANTRGADPRTIRKWLQAFHKMKLIKPIAVAVWEIL